ncbi:MAG: AI-2E family transporter, partial [Patescibacteria group bacterium]
MAKKNALDKFLKGTKQRLVNLRDKVEHIRHRQEKAYDELVKEPTRPEKETGHSAMEVHFSLPNVAKATVVVLALIVLSKFLNEIAGIILIFFVSVLFAAALDRTVDTLQRYKIPRAISVIGIYIILLFFIGFFISQMVPLIANQLFELAKTLTNLISNLDSSTANYPFKSTIAPILDDLLANVNREVVIDQLRNSLEGLGTQLQGFAGDTFGVIKTVFNGIFNFFLVLFITFFLVVDEKGVDKFFISLFPSKHGKYIVEKLEAIKHKVGYWLRGQVVLMVLMFFITWIVLSILGVDYALTLAMLTGLAELIPVVGAVIAGVPAVLVAFNESYWLAIWVFFFILILQQLEGNIIVPMVMKKAVGLSPLVVILAMLIGYNTFGLVGVIISVP